MRQQQLELGICRRAGIAAQDLQRQPQSRAACCLQPRAHPVGLEHADGPDQSRSAVRFRAAATANCPNPTSTSAWTPSATTGSSGSSRPAAAATSRSTARPTSCRPATSRRSPRASRPPAPAAARLSKLGINPLHWVNDPTIVGTETIGGAETTHIRAGINVAALLGDLNTFLGKASSSTKVIPGTISAAKRQKIAAEIKNPTVDVWTGNSDNTLRKLSLDLSFPVSGEISTLLGGTTSAGDRDDPSVLRPQPAADDPGAGQPAIVQRVRDEAARDRSAARGRGTGQRRAGRARVGHEHRARRPRPRIPRSTASACKRAGGDVGKMQKCASLINSGG